MSLLSVDASLATSGGSSGSGVFDTEYDPNFGTIGGDFDPAEEFTPYTVQTPSSSEAGTEAASTAESNLPAAPTLGTTGQIVASNSTINSETMILIVAVSAIALYFIIRKKKK